MNDDKEPIRWPEMRRWKTIRNAIARDVLRNGTKMPDTLKELEKWVIAHRYSPADRILMAREFGVTRSEELLNYLADHGLGQGGPMHAIAALHAIARLARTSRNAEGLDRILAIATSAIEIDVAGKLGAL